jgi:hypothetical protein
MNGKKHRKRRGSSKDPQPLFDLLVTAGRGYLEQFVVLNRTRIDEELRRHIVKLGDTVASEIAERSGDPRKLFLSPRPPSFTPPPYAPLPWHLPVTGPIPPFDPRAPLPPPPAPPLPPAAPVVPEEKS